MYQLLNPTIDPLPWLLEPDPDNPSIRYFTLTDLLTRTEEDEEVREARAAIMRSGPVPAILDAQYPEGFWVKAGGGYSPKYRGTVWQIQFMGELGADPTDERVRRGCEYVLTHTQARTGAFAASQTASPGSAIHCLTGNLLYALIRLGWLDDERVQAAITWLVNSITGDPAPRYYGWGTSGPGFACGINDGQPCAWGANKALKALLAIPADQRSPAVQRALDQGAEFLLSRDPTVADYPFTEHVSSTWFKLGFPLSYWSDVLETLQILTDFGYGDDSRLQNAIDFVLSKQDDQGRWKLQNSLRGKMWMDIERQGQPSKWITLRALRAVGEKGLKAEG
ncbi:MAG: hypothetical protein J5I90_20810 [Caldilineales bacterium]|nr:hypothetical protein [Caldilineales bacterium]